MAQLTMAQARSYVANLLDIDVSSGDGPTNVLNALNIAGRRVWEARPWFGREVDTVLFTVAPYTTGTATFTLASTAVVGVGTTWVAGMTGRKIALGIGSPWYRFTQTGATTGTIPTGGYAETTASGTTYSMFQDELDLPSTAETILAVNLFSARYRGGMKRATTAVLDDLYFVNPSLGVPYAWAPTLEVTGGIRRIRVTPIPDAIYRMRVRYVAAFTDLAAVGDLCVLGQNRERAWLLAACLEAQRVSDSKPVTNETEVQAAIQEAWIKEQATSPTVIRRTPLGSGAGGGGIFINDDRPFG